MAKVLHASNHVSMHCSPAGQTTTSSRHPRAGRLGIVRRSVVAALFVVVTVGVAAPPVSATVEQQTEPTSDPDAPTTTAGTVVERQVPTNDIIPLPNSGVAPERRGDRGGAGQLLLFFGMVGAIFGMGFLVWRESKRKIQSRDAQITTRTTRDSER